MTTNDDESRIVQQVQKSRQGRESTCAQLAHQYGVSAMTIYCILRSHGLGKRKPNWKPGLIDGMKAARYEFALRHQHWTLEDWKNVIWSNETSVVLGHRCGAVHVWRKATERYHKTCVRTPWKGMSEFMF